MLAISFKLLLDPFKLRLTYMRCAYGRIAFMLASSGIGRTDLASRPLISANMICIRVTVISLLSADN